MTKLNNPFSLTIVRGEVVGFFYDSPITKNRPRDVRLLGPLVGLRTVTVQYGLYGTVVRVKHPYRPDFRFTN